MTTLTLVLFILLLPLCLFLIGLILLQGGAGDISSAFGGGGQLDSTLGVGAGRKMSKITGWLSGSFMAIVLLLSIQHAGDFGKAAGEKPATGVNDGQTTPVVPPTPPTDQAPAVVPTSEGTAPLPTTPVPTAPAVEQSVAPAPVAPATTAPAATEQPAAPAVQPAPAPAAPQPVAPAEQPAPAPAAPRSGITLDEPAK